MDYQEGIHFSTPMERAILGAILLFPNGMSRTYGLVKAEAFHHEIHRHIYQVLLLMFKSGHAIDPLTTADYLFRRERVTMIDGKAIGWWIVEVTKAVTGDAHLEFWCSSVAEMHLQRELIAFTNGGIELTGDSRQMIGDLHLRLNELNRQKVGGDWEDASQLTVNLLRHQEEMSRSGGIGIKTGFVGIDNINGGIHKGQSILIAARPSVGKSAFAGQICLNMAEQGYKVGVISLEMSNTEIAARMMAISTDTNYQTIYRDLFADQAQRDWFYEKVTGGFATLSIFISDKTGVDIHEIRGKAEKLNANVEGGIDVLMIDYLQLVDGTDTGKRIRNREQEIAEISRGVKIMAKQMNIPVISLAQLNRQSTQRKGDDRYPYLSDLRESGSLEQDADVVMFLHRDYMAGVQISEDGNSTEYEADILIRKWRNGALGHLKLGFDPPKMRFFEQHTSFRPAPTIEPVKSYYETEHDETLF